MLLREKAAKARVETEMSAKWDVNYFFFLDLPL